MANIQQGQQPNNERGSNDLGNEHITGHGKKEDDSAIYLEPDEDNTLQTPEEFAKDKGKVLGDEDREITVDTGE
jgi:hypothetical protein